MKNKVLILIIFILSLICLIGYQIKLGYYKLYINSNNELIIDLFDENISCQLTENEIDEDNWHPAENKQCLFALEDKKYKLFLKDKYGNIKEIKEMENIGKVLNSELNTEKIFLALNESYTPILNISSIGNVDKNYTWISSDNSIVEIDENNQLIAKSVGSANITTTFNSKQFILKVEVTDKILKAPIEYDANKEYLSCEFYSESDNDLLDDILKNRISNVGYKTRAAAVEAARFLTLNFPYKINYFYENGRATTFDEKTLAYGEGRYYHEGLYLHSSRYSNILKSVNGPATWGCNLYSRIEKTYAANGLNCSGFIAWVLKNAGYDPGDIGAGITAVPDFTDISNKESLNQEIINSKKIKSGDLLHSYRGGGHIAIIVGIDETNYYVAEAYWLKPRGVVINTYSKTEITEYFSSVVLMDDYYQNDGNYTELWY